MAQTYMNSHHSNGSPSGHLVRLVGDKNDFVSAGEPAIAVL